MKEKVNGEIPMQKSYDTIIALQYSMNELKRKNQAVRERWGEGEGFCDIQKI